MNKIVYELILKLEQCDDKHNRCDYLLEHDEITYLLEYITKLQQENKQLKKKYENAVADYELEKYKNSKAIEYIEHTELYEVVYDDEGNYFNTFDDKATADLLQILGDKENE